MQRAARRPDAPADRRPGGVRPRRQARRPGPLHRRAVAALAAAPLLAEAAARRACRGTPSARSSPARRCSRPGRCTGRCTTCSAPRRTSSPTASPGRCAARCRRAGRARRVILSGGGTRNGLLWHLLEQQLGGVPLERTDRHGIPADARKAMTFGMLAALTVDGVPANVPSATGAAGSRLLGSLTPGVAGQLGALPRLDGRATAAAGAGLRRVRIRLTTRAIPPCLDRPTRPGMMT